MKTRDDILSRYTSLPVVIDVLTNRHLTLVSPSKWSDRNDAFALELYRKKSGIGVVLALCFTTREETFHHWSVFSDGIAGARIEFDKGKLLAALYAQGLTVEKVAYREIKALKNDPVALEKLPFTKRIPYQDEGELRVIFTTADSKKEAQEIPIPLDCVKRITLSPWLPKSLTKPVRDLLNQIKGCSRLKICRSTLLENDQWQSALKRS